MRCVLMVMLLGALVCPKAVGEVKFVFVGNDPTSPGRPTMERAQFTSGLVTKVERVNLDGFGVPPTSIDVAWDDDVVAVASAPINLVSLGQIARVGDVLKFEPLSAWMPPNVDGYEQPSVLLDGHSDAAFVSQNLPVSVIRSTYSGGLTDHTTVGEAFLEFLSPTLLDIQEPTDTDPRRLVLVMGTQPFGLAQHDQRPVVAAFSINDQSNEQWRLDFHNAITHETIGGVFDSAVLDTRNSKVYWAAGSLFYEGDLSDGSTRIFGPFADFERQGPIAIDPYAKQIYTVAVRNGEQSLWQIGVASGGMPVSVGSVAIDGAALERPTSLHLIVAPSSVPGDANLDGTVDLADFGAFKTGFGSSRMSLDFDDNGEVGLSDFGILKANFGKTGVTAAPEPSTGLLAVVGLLLLSVRLRRTHFRRGD